MFKRLRERIAEEATKFPVGQHSNNSGKPFPEPENKSAAANSTEDLITLSDSPAVVVPHTSSQQFSIGEEEDGSLSEQSTPQKTQNDVSVGSDTHSSQIPTKEQLSGATSDMGFGQEYRPKSSSYIPQSDIESEREEPPTLNLDGISKDQLMTAIQALKAKSYKYKNKYTEVVKNFKELRDEKIKIEHTLIENQDKGLRRIAELREQCQLEQKAKAHLEANLRILLEEKDSRISVLETQINLLKESQEYGSTNILPEDYDGQNVNMGTADARSEDSITLGNECSMHQEKIERLQHQHNQDKKTITAQKDQISLLRKQNENLSQELEDKMKRLNDLEDEQVKLKSEHEFILKNMQDRLEELEKQQEENMMSMAETKRNMHEELELKEKQLIKAEEESRQFQAIADNEKEMRSELQKQHEEKINELQRQLESTEKALEDEKQNLMQELMRGKTAAINLMQQECAKKIAAIEEEWKSKLQEIQLEKGNTVQSQVEELSKALHDKEMKLKQSEQRVDEVNSIIGLLEKENASLKNTIEKLESANLEVRHEESLNCMKDKLQNAEKNYKIEIEELKSQLSQLESKKASLEAENLELLSIQDKCKDLRSKENEMQLALKSKEEELDMLRQRLETFNKEQGEKIHTIQESMKDKENMILKLKGNIEAVTKDNSEKFEELSKKIKLLEEEREQLMLQAQERVSATEAKYREDVKSLQEINDKLLLENNELEKLKTDVSRLNSQLDESLLVAESNQAAASQEISRLKEQLTKTEEKCAAIESAKNLTESELSCKLEKLHQENNLLMSNSDHVERLKAEKEELNEKLKSVEQQMNEIRQLETERNSLKVENNKLTQELEGLKSVQHEKEVMAKNMNSLKESEILYKSEIEVLKEERGKLSTDISLLKESLESEIDILKSEKDKLLERINLLERFENCDPQNAAIKEYIAVIKGECETAMKAKELELESKLKHLVRDFCVQMDVKDKDCDQIISDMMEKSQDLEEKLHKEHRIEIAALKQELFEKGCALDEMRDYYEESLQEKDSKIKEYESIVNNFSQKNNHLASMESSHIVTESSDWDDTWAVPDEVVGNSSPSHSVKTCDEHLSQIESLQEELSKCNSEIKELKILLRLSPPETMVNNNNRRDSLNSIPEPTEFEYLKNIIYEYMMGKEPVTLAKVIAAVLRFSDAQTQQVIRREEARHPAK